MKVINKILLTCTLLMSALSCQKNDPKPYVRDLPSKFRFAIVDNTGQPLLTKSDQKVVLSFTQNGQNKEVTGYQLIALPTDNPLKGYIYSSLDAAMFSGDNGIREFYVNINGRTDTIYLEVEKSKTANAAGGLYTYRHVKFNGQEIVEQTDISSYVFKQQ
ncbi:hypothetical protein [Hymenobacter sp. YC55]|uniref:hypothetical protein n=1 Tax=Hymenobacter sp. YC55 TaxID=3034019 RepID=UPI0023F9DCE9|nr:hypothetical protein [Hymenobacter sp. YC55]MDF7815930.1 hypothetical protein [Hymenobacter sp. YC55]